MPTFVHDSVPANDISTKSCHRLYVLPLFQFSLISVMDSQFGSKSWGILGPLKYSRPLQLSHLLVRLFSWSLNRHLLLLPQLTLSRITTNLFPVSRFRYLQSWNEFFNYYICFLLRRWVNLFPFLNLQDFVKRNNPSCSFKKTDQNFSFYMIKISSSCK